MKPTHEMIIKALDEFDGNQSEVARRLKIPRASVVRALQKVRGKTVRVVKTGSRKQVCRLTKKKLDQLLKSLDQTRNHVTDLMTEIES